MEILHSASLLLTVLALLFTVASGLDKVPVWIPLLLLTVAVLVSLVR